VSTTATMRRVVLVDATMASVHLRLTYDIEVSAARIRQWGQRGLLTRRGEGPMHYDLREVIALAQLRGLLNPQ
jgi:hypothetical protein